MTEAGFSHNSAIRLINSLYMSKDEEDGYATADIVILNLFKGDCCFLKNGASATYLRHNRRVMMIESASGETCHLAVLCGYSGKETVEFRFAHSVGQRIGLFKP